MNSRLIALGLLMLTGLPCAWAGDVRNARIYLDQVVVVLKAGDVAARHLPFRSSLSDGSIVETHQALQACRGVARQPDELLVFLPASGTCFLLADQPSVMRPEKLSLKGALGLQRERADFAEALSSAKLLVMETLPLPPETAQICVCPPREELIFLDGFELIQ